MVSPLVQKTEFEGPPKGPQLFKGKFFFEMETQMETE